MNNEKQHPRLKKRKLDFISVGEVTHLAKKLIESPRKKIVVGEKHFQIPVDIFCERSEYFNAMFRGNFAETNDEEVKIDIPNPDLVEIIFDFLNTGYMKPNAVTEENIFNLLATAQYLQLKGVEDYIFDILENTFQNPSTTTKAKEDLVSSVKDVVKLPNYKSITLSSLQRMLCFDCLDYLQKIMLLVEWNSDDKSIFDMLTKDRFILNKRYTYNCWRKFLKVYSGHIPIQVVVRIIESSGFLPGIREAFLARWLVHQSDLIDDYVANFDAAKKIFNPHTSSKHTELHYRNILVAMGCNNRRRLKHSTLIKLFKNSVLHNSHFTKVFQRLCSDTNMENRGEIAASIYTEQWSKRILVCECLSKHGSLEEEFLKCLQAKDSDLVADYCLKLRQYYQSKLNDEMEHAKAKRTRAMRSLDMNDICGARHELQSSDEESEYDS